MILPILLLAATLLRPLHRRQPDPYLTRIAVAVLDDTSWREGRRRVIRTAEVVDEAMRDLAAVVQHSGVLIGPVAA